MHSYIFTCSYLMLKSYSILSLPKVMIAGFLNFIPLLILLLYLCTCICEWYMWCWILCFKIFAKWYCVYLSVFFFYFFWLMYVDTCSCSLFSLTAVWYSIIQYIKYVCLAVNGYFVLCPFLLQCCSDHLYTFLCACISL